MPFVARMAAGKSKPDIHIAQEEEGKHWTVRFEAFVTMEMKFELGVEFEETPPFGGATHKAIATLEDDGTKLKIASQTEKGEVVRIFSLGDDGKELKVVSAQNKVIKHMHLSLVCQYLFCCRTSSAMHEVRMPKGSS